jgi:RNA polymerase sigma-70 factor (ECF subfamily)
MKADENRAPGLMMIMPLQKQEDQAQTLEPLFESLFNEHWPRIHGAMARLVADADDAEDLALEAFQRLYEHLRRGGSRQNIGGWLFRTATNLGLNVLRQEARRKRREQKASLNALTVSGEPDPADAVANREDQVQVRAILAEMKPKNARLLVLRAQGMSYQDLAVVLSVSAGSIGTLLNRAEQEFEKRYRARYGDER